MLKTIHSFCFILVSQNTVRVREHGEKAWAIYKTFRSSKTGGGGGGQ